MQIRRTGTDVSLAGTLPEGPAVVACPPAVRSGFLAKPSATFSRLLILFLVLTVTAVGTIHTAEDGPVVPIGGFGYSAVDSHDHLAQGTGENEEQSCSAGPKAQRGVVEKDSVDKTCALLGSRAASQLRSENAKASPNPVFVGFAPKDGILPQELLRRPPPA